MNKSFYIVLPWVLILSGCPVLTGQKPDFRKITIKEADGVSMAEVFSITEDEKGFIWMSNYYGLMRYDGSSVKIYANSPIDTQSITFGGLNYLKNSRNHGLWVGSLNGGVSFFDLNSEKAINYLNDPTDPASLSSNQVTVPFEDPEGRLWVGASDFTLNLLLDRDKGTFRHFRPELPPGMQLSASEPGILGEIVQDPTDPDLLWLGSKLGLYSFEKSAGRFTFFPFPQDRIIETWYRDYPIEMLIFPDRRIWLGSYNTGLMQFDPADHSWRSWRNENNLTDNAIANSVIELIDAGDDLLLVTVRTGELWWFNRKTNAFEIENLQPGTTGLAPAIYSALKRPDGDIWLGRGTDIMVLTRKPPAIPFVSLRRKNPQLTSNNWMRASLLSTDKTRLYLGTLHGDGLLVWDLKNDQISSIRYNPSRDTQDVFMDDLFLDKTGRLWIGSANGLLYLDPGAARIRSATHLFPALERLANSHLTAVSIAAGRIWIGAEHNGLFTLDMASGTLEAVQEPLFKEVTINKIAADPHGRIWIGCNRGLSFFDPASGRYTCFGKSTRKKNGLSNAQVNDFDWDQNGGMWIATLGGGINYLAPAQGGNPVFRYFVNDGTPGCNNIYHIGIHPNGQIWLGTDSGLSMLDPDAGIFINYDKRDGMFAKIGSLQVLPNGYFLSGGNMGFHYFHPDSLLHSESTPVPYIKNFKIFDRELQLQDKLTLAPGQNHFSLELGALNFNINARNTYMYRLQGHDQDWVFSGARDYVAYTNLKPGPYRFEVKAANRHNAWSDKTAAIDIYIRPHFWEADWFRMAVALGLAITGWVLNNYWKFKQREKQAQQIIDYYANSSYNFSTEDDILWDLASNYISRLNFEDCVIYLLDKKRQVLVQKAAFGPKNPKANEIHQPIEIPVGKGIVGSVALSGEGAVIEDVRKDPRYIPDHFAGRSEITVPIIQDDEVIGIIDAEHSEPGFFKPYHLQLLSTMAALCANKLAAARAGLAIAEKETQLLELDKHLAETQLIALRAQMNPHFLFNCLNSINWYIVKNKPREASRYLTKFSRLIRLILDHSKARQITLEKELEALKLYIEIEAMRFDEKFDFRLEVDERLDLEEILIPPLIFQPYVENAIWHGLMQAPYPGCLRIKLRPKGRYLECIIEDNGIGRQAAKALQQQSLATKSSQGMSITAKRILLHQQQSGSETPVEIIDLYDETGQPAGTSVRLNLPI